MKFTATIFALAALAVGQAAATPLAHRRFHQRREAHPLPGTVELSKRNLLTTSAKSQLSSLSILTGSNADSNNGQAWLGNDSIWTNTFINKAAEDITLVVWGPQGSWVNVNTPLITVTIPSGSEQIVSFAEGASGAFAAVYPDTKTVNGQVSQTWGEYTFSGAYTTLDVSREVNMNGRDLTIVTPECTSSMTECVFKCSGGVSSCWETYELVNCAIGSQKGANYGTSYGAPSGGCSGMTASGAAITSTFS